MCSHAVALWKRRLDPYVMKNYTTEFSGLQPFSEKLPDLPNKTFFLKLWYPWQNYASLGNISHNTKKTQICKIM